MRKMKAIKLSRNKAFLKAHILLLILLIALGSLIPANCAVIKPEKNATNYIAPANFSDDISSSMAPNEGDIQEWIPVSKAAGTEAKKESSKPATPGFDFLMASFSIAALSAVQIKRRSQAIKKK
jgi:hypothetical protein